MSGIHSAGQPELHSKNLSKKKKQNQAEILKVKNTITEIKVNITGNWHCPFLQDAGTKLQHRVTIPGSFYPNSSPAEESHLEVPSDTDMSRYTPQSDPTRPSKTSGS